jgi:hypothetical protein
MSKRAWVVVVAGAVGCLAGCSDDGRTANGAAADAGTRMELLPSPAAKARLERLDARFAAHATRGPIAAGVATRFEAEAGRLRVELPANDRRSHPKPARVELPVSFGDSASVTDEQSGMSVSFQLLDASPERVAVARGLALYEGAAPGGGDVVHRPTAHGVEDFVVLERGAEQLALRYEVDVSRAAGLRLVENVLELLDAGGAPRLRVVAPYALGSDGRRSPLLVDVEGCAVDRDPAPPWDRAVIAPGAPSCQVVVSLARDLAYPVLVDPAWTTTGSMSAERWYHVATLLTSGRVLVAGGRTLELGFGVMVDTAEIYDPSTGTWATTGSLAAPREVFAAQRLPDGDVLAFGGPDGGSGDTSERWDSVTGTWSSAPSMLHGRREPRAASLSDGDIVVISDPAPERYDYATNQWAMTGPTAGRYKPTLTTLSDGRVLLAGGETTTGVEIYDPSSNTWSPAASMAGPHYDSRAVRLTNGKVLLVGGKRDAGNSPPSAPELYDPVANSWSAAGSHFRQASFVFVPLSSSRALVLGGCAGNPCNTTAMTHLYDPAANAWIEAGAMSLPRDAPTATLLAGGSVLAAGGYIIATAELFEFASNGAACSVGGECVSGNCVDGVCCASACNTACRACSNAKTGQADGTCAPIPSGQDSDSECPNDGAASCDRDGFCDGAGACRLHAAATVCLAASCADTTSVNVADTCNGTGTCVDGGVTPCQTGYVCAAGACKTSCAADSDCTPSYFCDAAAGECKTDKPAGGSCTQASQCVSGFCVDGRCCESACSGLCLGCSNALTGQPDGECRPVSAATDPNDECAVQAPQSCGRTGLCDGQGACSLYASGTECAPRSCAGPAVENAPDTCDGSGACVDRGTVDCPTGYACSGTACTTSCSVDGDCIAEHYCKSGSCSPDEPNGTACASAAQCASGHCVDGVCCDAACDGACRACSAAKKGQGADGACDVVVADSDPDGECPADPGFPASCGPDGECDGTGQCRAFAKTSVSCGTTTCQSNDVSGLLCNGAGQCLTSTTSCEPYRCVASGCGTSCASDGECAPGAFCTSQGTCAFKNPNGSDCDQSKECTSGFCADGFCCESVCAGQCEACNVAPNQGACLPVSGAPRESRPQCAGDSGACAGACDGQNRTTCAYPASGTACAAATCEDAIATAQLCDGAGACKASTERCEPFTCETDTCRSSCLLDEHCTTGFRCDEAAGRCTPATGRCVDDDAAVESSDGVKTPCAPYRCAAGQCRDACSASVDCAAGHVCNDAKCIPSKASGAAGDDGGCSCSQPVSGSPPGGWLSGLVLLWALRRRRAVSTGGSTRKSRPLPGC